MITISDAEQVLKDYYLDVVNTHLNGEISPFYNAITKTSENVFGKQINLGIVKSGMSSVRACDEDEDLPYPESNRYYNICERLKNIYGTIEISDKLIRSSADSSGAFISVLNSEMDGLISDAKRNFARMLYGTENGKLTEVVRKVSTYVLEVKDTKSYFENLTVYIRAGASAVNAVITAVDKAANTITLSKSLDSYTFSGGEEVLIKDAAGKELKGLSYIFDSSTLYGYDKSTESYFNPYVAEVAKASLTEADLMQTIDEIEERSGGKINMILCSYKTRRAIAALFESSKQIVNTTDIHAGCTNIFVNTVPVYADAFCPEGRIYFLNTDDFVLCQLCDWSWLENESGRVLTQVAGRAAFTATLVKYAELICKRPCGQGLIKLTD